MKLCDLRYKVYHLLARLPSWNTLTVIVLLLISCTGGYGVGRSWPEVATAPAVPMTSADAANLLVNPSFEDGWTRQTLYWTPDGGPYSNAFGEIFTPAGWVTWWYEGFPCATGYTFDQGRPEVQVIGLSPDPERVRDGAQALKQFTFWRCHHFGLLQQIPAEPGARYAFTAYGHAWHTDCSQQPHNPPLSSDCSEVLGDSWDHLQAGIDPTGGVDPGAPTVVWGAAVEQYGVYGAQIAVRSVEAQAETITVFLASECNFPLKHDDVYWDQADVQRVYSVYLPLVQR